MAKRNSGGGGFGRFIAFLLALIVGAGVVFGILYRKHVAVVWNKAMNFLGRVDDEVKESENNGDGAGNENETPGEGENSATAGQLQMDASEENGVSLAMVPLLASEYEENGVSEHAESAVKITATVMPDYATDKTLTWTLMFVPQNEEQTAWAQGKNVTDYVTVTPGADTKTASVSCLQAFGSQVELRVTAKANPDAHATVVLDYMQRYGWGANTSVRLMNASGSQVSMGPYFMTSFDLNDYNQSYEAYYEASNWAFDPDQSDYSDGTIKYDNRDFYLELCIDESLYEILEEYNIPLRDDFYAVDYSGYFDNISACNIQDNIKLNEWTENKISLIYIVLNAIDYEEAGFSNDATIEDVIEKYGESYKVALNEYFNRENSVEVRIARLFLIGKEDKQSSHYTTEVYSSALPFEIAPENVTTDNENIIF